MEALLSQLNSVPGVVGSMACDAEGAVLGWAFPPTFGEAALKDAAAALASRSPALEAALGEVGLIDLRYASARIVVKAAAGGRLLCLCTPSVNLQLLSMSSAGVVRRLESLAGAPGPHRGTGGGALYQAVQRIGAAIERSPGDRVKLRGLIALKAGFSLDLVDAETPDDPARLEKLEAAAKAVLGHPF